MGTEAEKLEAKVLPFGAQPIIMPKTFKPTILTKSERLTKYNQTLKTLGSMSLKDLPLSQPLVLTPNSSSTPNKKSYIVMEGRTFGDAWFSCSGIPGYLPEGYIVLYAGYILLVYESIPDTAYILELQVQNNIDEAKAPSSWELKGYAVDERTYPLGSDKPDLAENIVATSGDQTIFAGFKATKKRYVVRVSFSPTATQFAGWSIFFSSKLTCLK
jgi:hypothetical protein